MIPDILVRFLPAASSDWHGRSSPSNCERWLGPTAILAAAGVGALGWSGHALALPTAVIFPFLWAQSCSRRVAATVSAAYFLAASRGLPQGVANFYSSDLWPGLLLWLAAALSFVAVHAALWTRQPKKGGSVKSQVRKRPAVRYLAAAVLVGLPPFGVTGWAHPLTAAGILFPGWGWCGLIATAAGLAIMTSRYWPVAAVALAGFWLWSAATWTQPVLADGWRGVDLVQGQILGRDGSLEYHRDLIATVRSALSSETRFIALPESALGFWTPTVERLWQDGLRGLDVKVVAGAAVIDANGYDNVIVGISAEDARILYRERMPVPGSMWQPWRVWAGQEGGARANLTGDPVAEFAGARLAPLICYEQLILWPTLQSMLYFPHLVVAIGNGWWTSGTSIVAIQRASAIAWAKLFGVPIVMAFNT